MDSENAIEGTMRSNLYKEMYADINNDYIKVVEQNLEANEQYLRYWHGSMLIIRPMLVFLNIEQIYFVNKIIMYSLSLILLVLLFRKSKKIAIIYLISMLMISFIYVTYCLEYSWTFYIMLIISIISVLIEKRGNDKLYVIFFLVEY